MALKKTITLKNNFGLSNIFDDAYIKVNSVSGTKESVTAYVDFKKDEQVLMQKGFQFAPNMEGANFIKQAYEHLKTLDEFDGAIDC